MRKLTWATLLTLLTVVTLSQPVLADTHTGRNVLGLASEANETGVFLLSDHPTGDLQLHLMVYGYTHQQGIVGWDCAVHLPDDIVISETILMGQGVNRHPQPGNFKVYTVEPLMPVNGLIHLATLNLRTLNPLPKQIFLGPDPLWGNNGMMGFARQTYETIRTPFNWPESCKECPVFELVNGIQPTESLAWGGIKSLYR